MPDPNRSPRLRQCLGGGVLPPEIGGATPHLNLVHSHLYRTLGRGRTPPSPLRSGKGMLWDSQAVPSSSKAGQNTGAAVGGPEQIRPAGELEERAAPTGIIGEIEHKPAVPGGGKASGSAANDVRHVS